MKIVMVSNAYPPYTTGGYEIACYDNVQRLRAKGHEVHVLTSMYRRNEHHPLDTDKQVYRKLMLEAKFYQFKPSFLIQYNPLRQQLARIKDSIIFKKYLKKINPDIVLFWNMGIISFSLIAMAEKLKPTAYFISDCWLAYPPWYATFKDIPFPTTPLSRYPWKRFIKKAAVPLKVYLPNPQNLIFCSLALQKIYLDIGYPFEKAEIIYHGIDPNTFYPNNLVKKQLDKVRLLYCGRLTQYKGVETLIHALDILVNQKKKSNVQLTLVGKGENPAYPDILKQMVEKLGINQYLEWIPGVEREKMRELYTSHDILIFPSIWAEPFSITILEAMASGIPIIGTTKGGSREIFKDKENCLVFQEDNPQHLAEQIISLMQDIRVYNHIRENALQTVKQYTLDHMSDKIEHYLEKVILMRKSS